MCIMECIHLECKHFPVLERLVETFPVLLIDTNVDCQNKNFSFLNIRGISFMAA